MVPVSPKIYLVENLGESGNVAFPVTDDGVLVVDSGALPVHGRTIVEKVRSVTDRPIVWGFIAPNSITASGSTCLHDALARRRLDLIQRRQTRG